MFNKNYLLHNLIELNYQIYKQFYRGHYICTICNITIYYKENSYYRVILMSKHNLGKMDIHKMDIHNKILTCDEEIIKNIIE